MRYSLRRKKKKKLASNAACPNSLCSVRLDCPGPSSRRSAEGRGGGIPPPPVPRRSRLPPAGYTNNNPSPSKTPPPKKKSCLFAVKIIEWRSVCLRSLRRLRCQDSLVLYSFISPPVCCLAPHLIREGYKEITSEGDESRQLFVHLYSYFLAVCVKVF